MTTLINTTMLNTKILAIASAEFGVKEFAGKAHNPDVLKYFHETGFDGAHITDETAWCSAFANWVAKKAGAKISGKLTARSWLNVGETVETPQIGDFAVLWRESPKTWKGHVGVFIRETKTHVYLLGGNQRNSVCTIAYPKSRLLGYRRLQPQE